MTARVVAIKCPSCKGSGLFMHMARISCMWCKGVKKLRKNEALRFANNLVTLGIGGYICGDHDLPDQKKMLRESDRICKIFGAKVFEPNAAR